MKVGDRVRVLAPFAVHFPGVYTIDAVRTNPGAKHQTCTIFGDRDFDEEFLKVTNEAVTHASPVTAEPTVTDRIAAIEAELALLKRGG